MSEKCIGYLAAITATTIFGLTFLFSKMALVLVTPVHLVALRFLCSSAVLCVLVVLGIIPVHLKGKNWGALVRLSLFQPVAYFTFETYGLFYGTSSEAGLFVALIPVSTAIVSGLLLHESVSRRQGCFLACSVCGAIFIVLMDGLVLESALISKVFFLLAVISASFFTVGSRKQSVYFTPWEITFVMSLTAAVVFNLWAVVVAWCGGNLQGYFMPLANLDFLLPLLFLSVAASMIAFFCTNLALTKIPAYRYAVFDNASTIISILAGVFFLEERLYWYHWVGAAIILLGVWGTNYFHGREEKS